MAKPICEYYSDSQRDSYEKHILREATRLANKPAFRAALVGELGGIPESRIVRSEECRLDEGDLTSGRAIRSVFARGYWVPAEQPSEEAEGGEAE